MANPAYFSGPGAQVWRSTRYILTLSLCVLSIAFALIGAIANSTENQEHNSFKSGANLPVVGSDLTLMPDVDGSGEVYESPNGSNRIGILRGHHSQIASAAVVDNGTAILTVDTSGQVRKTRVSTLKPLSRLEISTLGNTLKTTLWEPYAAPVASTVSAQPWRPARTAYPISIAFGFLAFTIFGAPKVLTRLSARSRRASAPSPTPTNRTPSATSLTPLSVWQDRIPGIPAQATSRMVTLPRGRFMMGSPETEVGRSDDEGPQHVVSIDYVFAIGMYPITFAQWDAAISMGAKLYRPSDMDWGRGDRPVINVSWQDIQQYLNWLNTRLGLMGQKDAYRLPSEAEWEYASRAGMQTSYSFGDDASELGLYAWYRDNSQGKTQPVGQKRPNGFGLYDMHGNVWDWMQDQYSNDYTGAPLNGSAREFSENPSRVLRGGSWVSLPQNLRSAYRDGNAPSNRSDSLGFRVARTLTQRQARPTSDATPLFPEAKRATEADLKRATEADLDPT